MQDTNISYRASEAREYGINIAILLNNIRVFTEYHNQKGDKQYWHSMIDIAEAVGLTPYQVREAAKKAQKLGLIKYRQSYKPNSQTKTTYWTLLTSESAETATSVVQENGLSEIPETGTSYINIKEINIKDKNITAKAEDTISVLYFEALKVFNVPVRNYNNVRSSIAKMKTEDSEENLIKYLTFIRDKYQSLTYDYKPEINEALDIYAKRQAIISSVQRLAGKQQKERALVL